MAEEQRYILLEAAELLGISKGALVRWINNDGLRVVVDSQVMPHDKRAHYLTRTQLEKLAKDHRRTLKNDAVRQNVVSTVGTNLEDVSDVDILERLKTLEDELKGKTAGFIQMSINMEVAENSAMEFGEEDERLQQLQEFWEKEHLLIKLYAIALKRGLKAPR